MMSKARKVYEIYKNSGSIEVLYNIILKIKEEDKKRCMEGNKCVDGSYYSIPEITSLTPKETNFKGKRLNLLVPSLEKEHIFGGISTALNLFEYMTENYEFQRIIVTDSKVDNIDIERFKEYEIDNKSNKNRTKSICPMANRFGRTIDVGENDYFVSTAWWTAYILQPILEWQQKTYDIEPVFYYIIQDFEPGFYQWSSRYSLAESTYKSKFKTKAILNTKILYDFFVEKGYSFYQQAYFNPPLNRSLANRASLASKQARREPFKILVYGRPGVGRNCFEICIESLQKFASQYENLHKWELYSVGEKHQDIILSPDCKLKSLGKLPLDQYQNILESSSVGLSLMVSPHPSYPPIEMASYGLEVITNRYENKNLSNFFTNIHSLEKLTPNDVMETLIQVCREVEKRSGKPSDGKNSYLAEESWEKAFISLGNILREK
ncbi:hypothetical protein MSSIH_2856 [Methanosarcina siciliae HI350]|uniref:Glycosyl transferase family 1 domain-containing protein n=1 Tax=Methanosarcina siciliae HI350 TaxID=1434119 RepID=A0A0E3LBC8_9EURY|nr:hypothetical protein [Methanosarcina siciliae]AKB33546.1 hypothetical protein MSSIH_2856 [Methanosarcina siciliae HI350]